MQLMYSMNMRTTISLDDRLAEQVRRRAAEEGVSVSALIARMVDDGLKRRAPRADRPFRLVTVGGEGVLPGVDLDRPRALDAEEDEAMFPRSRGRA